MIIGLVDCREELSCPKKSFQQEHNSSGAVDPEEVDAVNNCSDRSQKTEDGMEVEPFEYYIQADYLSVVYVQHLLEYIGSGFAATTVRRERKMSEQNGCRAK